MSGEKNRNYATEKRDNSMKDQERIVGKISINISYICWLFKKTANASVIEKKEVKFVRVNGHSHLAESFVSSR